MAQAGAGAAMGIEGGQRQMTQQQEVPAMSKISVTTNMRKQKIIEAQKRQQRDAEEGNGPAAAGPPETLSMSGEGGEERQEEEKNRRTHPQQFLTQNRFSQHADSQPKTELTEEFRATHGNITVGQMPSGELISQEDRVGSSLELEVESPYLDKAALNAKIGLQSQNVKHDSYFKNQQEAFDIERLQTDHANESQKKPSTDLIGNNNNNPGQAKTPDVGGSDEYQQLKKLPLKKLNKKAAIA